MSMIGLKIIRVKHDLTQEETAKRLKCSRSTYALIENGKRGGSREFWNRVQQTFQLSDGEMWRLQNGKEK